MQRALLNHLACPACESPLTCHVHREAPGPPGREPGIDEGLLLCDGCGRWFPISGQLPELLPDHLRDAAREREMFARLAVSLPAGVRRACERFVPGAPAADDAGAHHKAAEIGIRSRIENPDDFFGPGHGAPFNPHRTEFSLYLIHLFGAVVPLLECRQGHVIVDSGCGYSWTTEWLHRSGLEVIGVDICRAYLEIGIQRIGPDRPHLVVADVEHLPIRSAAADAVLAYESFHHVPDRPRAMRGYARVLKPGGRVVLAEPGAAHEAAPGSVEVSAKYGILERGMELADVAGYVEGLPFGAPDQIFFVQAQHGDLSKRLVDVARANSPVEGNVFRLRRRGDDSGTARAASDVAGPDVIVMAAEAPRLRAQLEYATSQLRETQLALAQATDRIFHMERSLFWRLRGIWTSARGLFRSGRSDRSRRT